MKKRILISNYSNFIKPNISMSERKKIRKSILNEEIENEKNFKEKRLNLIKFQKDFNLEELRDLKTLHSIFIHPTTTTTSTSTSTSNSSSNSKIKKRLEEENLNENKDERLTILGESILDSFITSFLLQNFEFVEMKWKKEIIDLSVNGILNKIVNELNFENLILINESNLNHIIEKYKITSLLRLIGYIYLRLGIESCLLFLQNSILPLILKFYKFDKKFNYKKEIEELFAIKFNCHPRFEIEFENENNFIVSLYSNDSNNKFFGISEGNTFEIAIENVSKEVFNNLTKFDKSKDFTNYK